jgi:hypothetical protein
MIKYANLYETNDWKYFLSKEVLNVKAIQKKKNCLLGASMVK